MASNLKDYALWLCLILFCFSESSAQSETSEWKFQISFGFNDAIDNNTSDQFTDEGLNFPSINLGVQHMFSRTMGARLDYGYNRSKFSQGSQEVKFNFSRINAQFVYDFKSLLNFLPPRMTILGHVGPGLTFTKPLGSFSDNTYTYFNALGGLEVHVGIAQTVSLFGDFSYVFGLSGNDKYDPLVDGFSFNGDLIYFSVGVAVSLSGCYFCDE